MSFNVVFFFPLAEAESLTLTRDEPLPKTSRNSRFMVVQSGLFVMVYTDIGISLQWDRGTRIYVIVEPRWSGRVSETFLQEHL